MHVFDYAMRQGVIAHTFSSRSHDGGAGATYEIEQAKVIYPPERAFPLAEDTVRINCSRAKTRWIVLHVEFAVPALPPAAWRLDYPIFPDDVPTPPD